MGFDHNFYSLELTGVPGQGQGGARHHRGGDVRGKSGREARPCSEVLLLLQSSDGEHLLCVLDGILQLHLEDGDQFQAEGPLSDKQEN